MTYTLLKLLLYSLVDKALWCVSLSLQVACGPVTVDQLPVPVNEHCIPAVVRRCTGDWSTRLIVHTLRPSRKCHTMHSRVPTMTIHKAVTSKSDKAIPILNVTYEYWAAANPKL